MDEHLARNLLRSEVQDFANYIHDFIQDELHDTISIEQDLDNKSPDEIKLMVLRFYTRRIFELIAREYGPDDVRRLFDNTYWQIYGGDLGPSDFGQVAKPYKK